MLLRREGCSKRSGCLLYRVDPRDVDPRDAERTSRTNEVWRLRATRWKRQTFRKAAGRTAK